MLKLTLFGQFSIQTHSASITEESLHAPRILRAMIYLFAERNKRIPLRDFSAFLHEGKHSVAQLSYSASSDSLVKTTLHRIRAQFLPLQVEEPCLRLVVADGGIRFDPSLVIVSDVDRFDEIHRELSDKRLISENPERALFLFRTLFSLYKGKYLAPLADDDFAIAKTKDYHDKYLALCEEFFPLLYHLGNLDEVINMASGGIAIDPYFELFHYWKIRAFAEKGDKALALLLYDGVERLFDSHFHIKPSLKLRKLKETLTLAPKAPSAQDALSSLSASASLSLDAFSALVLFANATKPKDFHFLLLTLPSLKDADLCEKELMPQANDRVFFCRFSQEQIALLCHTQELDRLRATLEEQSLSFTLDTLSF